MTELERARHCARRMYETDSASQMLGITVDIPAAGEAIAAMRVRPDMVNGLGVCHGGLIFSLADTAFAFACNAYDLLTVAASASVDFLRPANEGDRLTATAVEDHRGRLSGVYSVEVRNQRGEAVALFRGRSASRDRRLLK